MLMRNEIVLLVKYDRSDKFLQRQLNLARLFGCMIVRWWVGSDVLYCLRSEAEARASQALDRLVDLNLAVAPHLVEELAAIGIRAEFSPSVCNLSTGEAGPPTVLPRSVLVYLPSNRKDFYGHDLVAAAIEKNRDLEFVIVGDESHALSAFPNVCSLGWIEDMGEIWPRVGVLLRMTEHDGLPRMVLEALANSRYVIYAWPLDGCWHARSCDEMLRYLECFKGTTEPNAAGPLAAQNIAGTATRRLLDTIGERQPSCGLTRRIGAALGIVQYHLGPKES